MDGILRGAAAQASEESDRFISSAVRSNLFRNRAFNEGSRRFHNYKECPYKGLLLVESSN